MGVRRGDGAEFYFHTDALDSVITLSNSSGYATERYEYSGYGRMLVEDSSGTPIIAANRESSLLFTGRNFDDETTIQDSRARAYDPAIGQFISEDPIGFSGGINFYQYGQSNPNKFTDPGGTQVAIAVPASILVGIAACIASGACKLTEIANGVKDLMCMARDEREKLPKATVRCQRVGGLSPTGNPPKCIYRCLYRGREYFVPLGPIEYDGKKYCPNDHVEEVPLN